MCDNLIALPILTESGKTIFAKNSDREPNEAQSIVHLPPTKTTTPFVQCTYIRIPQVAETYEAIISKPFWSWGAEMGVNKFSVIIGNQPAFSRVPIAKDNKSLTGSDLVRLGLERSRSAAEALKTITALLQQFGSDGCVGYQNKKLFSHHSYIIADPVEAWILETAGREWVAEKITDCRTISDGYTIHEKFDLISPGAVAMAEQNKWHVQGKPFDFAKSFAAEEMNLVTACKVRQRVTQLGINRRKQFDLRDAFSILSEHQMENFKPERSTTAEVCMHATTRNPIQTANSMVILIDQFSQPEIWTTGTSHPCLSFFKPIRMEGGNFDMLKSSGTRSDQSFWWTVERFHRLSDHDYEAVRSYVQENIHPYFEQMLDNMNSGFDSSKRKGAFEFHLQAAEEGFQKLRGAVKKHFFLSSPGRFWKGQNEKAQLSF